MHILGTQHVQWLLPLIEQASVLAAFYIMVHGQPTSHAPHAHQCTALKPCAHVQAVQPGQQQPWPPLASAQPLQIAPAARMQRLAATQGAHTGRSLQRGGPAWGLPAPLLDASPQRCQADTLEVNPAVLILALYQLAVVAPVLHLGLSACQADTPQVDLAVLSLSTAFSLCQLASGGSLTQVSPHCSSHCSLLRTAARLV